jgi:hypothetical protein
LLQLCSSKRFYLTLNPHGSYSHVRADEFELLNCLISIPEAQDISISIFNMKVENPAARRILARVY